MDRASSSLYFYPQLDQYRFGRAQLRHKSCAEKLCDRPVSRRDPSGTGKRAVKLSLADPDRVSFGTVPWASNLALGSPKLLKNREGLGRERGAARCRWP